MVGPMSTAVAPLTIFYAGEEQPDVARRAALGWVAL